MSMRLYDFDDELFNKIYMFVYRLSLIFIYDVFNNDVTRQCIIVVMVVTNNQFLVIKKKKKLFLEIY